MSKVGIFITVGAIFGLIGSALIYNLSLCLMFGILIGVGLVIAIIGDDL